MTFVQEPLLTGEMASKIIGQAQKDEVSEP